MRSNIFIRKAQYSKVDSLLLLVYMFVCVLVVTATFKPLKKFVGYRVHRKMLSYATFLLVHQILKELLTFKCAFECSHIFQRPFFLILLKLGHKKWIFHREKVWLVRVTEERGIIANKWVPVGNLWSLLICSARCKSVFGVIPSDTTAVDRVGSFHLRLYGNSICHGSKHFE